MESTISNTSSVGVGKHRLRYHTAMAILIASVFIFFVGKAGFELRQWTWELTTPIRSVADVHRAFGWGHLAARESFLNQYEKMRFQKPTDSNWLDVTPLRLGLLTVWGKWAAGHYPNVNNWEQNPLYAFTAPMLWLNLFLEIIGVVSAFFLTRLWVIRRANDAGEQPMCPGWLAGLIAGSLLWLNPAMILNGYGWPPWELCIVPMFLLASLLASLDWWFAAGIVIGIGVMLESQLIFIAPVFILWPLILRKPTASLRWLTGLTVASAVIVSPWLLTYIPSGSLAAARVAQSKMGEPWQTPLGVFAIARVWDVPAVLWVLGLIFVAVAMPIVSKRRFGFENTTDEVKLFSKIHAKRVLSMRMAVPTLVAILTAVMVMWPWILPRNRVGWPIGMTLAIILSAAVLLSPRRAIGYLPAATAGVGLLLCMSVFHGTSAWWDCGFHYGMIHWPVMTVGVPSNLPAIMESHFGWRHSDLSTMAAVIPAKLFVRWPKVSIAISLQTFLQIIFAIAVVMSGIAIGMQSRRRDSRILLALTTPWIIFFVILPQMPERYLLFAAAISCICIGDSLGMTLLGMVLTFISWAMMLHAMLIQPSADLHGFSQRLAKAFPSLFDPIDSGFKVRRFVEGLHPDIGWAVVLCGAIFLYFSLATRKRRRKTLSLIPDLQQSAGGGDSDVLVAVG